MRRENLFESLDELLIVNPAGVLLVDELEREQQLGSRALQAGSRHAAHEVQLPDATGSARRTQRLLGPLVCRVHLVPEDVGEPLLRLSQVLLQSLSPRLEIELLTGLQLLVQIQVYRLHANQQRRRAIRMFETVRGEHYTRTSIWIECKWTRLREMRVIEVQPALELVAEVPDGSPAREQLVELLSERREPGVRSLCLLRGLRARSGRRLPHWRCTHTLAAACARAPETVQRRGRLGRLALLGDRRDRHQEKAAYAGARRYRQRHRHMQRRERLRRRARVLRRRRARAGAVGNHRRTSGGDGH